MAVRWQILIDHVKNCMLDMLPPEYKEVVLGHAAIKAIYDIGKLGRIAGSQRRFAHSFSVLMNSSIDV